MDRAERMPVIRRADEHGIDVLALEHFAEMATAGRCMALPLLLDAFGRLARPGVIGIGQRHALSARVEHQQ